MPSDVISRLSGYPPPHSDRVGRGTLAAVLSLPPLVWFLQTLANYSLISNGCGQRGGVGAPPIVDWPWLWWAVISINGVAIALAVIAVLLAVRAWRVTRDEARGEPHGLIEVGEGRSRFFSAWAIVGGAAFFVLGTAFATIFIFLVPLCAN